MTPVAAPISSRSFAASKVPGEGCRNKLATVFKLRNLPGKTGPKSARRSGLICLADPASQPAACHALRDGVASVDSRSKSAKCSSRIWSLAPCVLRGSFPRWNRIAISSRNVRSRRSFCHAHASTEAENDRTWRLAPAGRQQLRCSIGPQSDGFSGGLSHYGLVLVFILERHCLKAPGNHHENIV